MTELFDLGGIVAVVVAAYQSSLLQALLNGYAAPAMYAEELGLDATATERVLDVLPHRYVLPGSKIGRIQD